MRITKPEVKAPKKFKKFGKLPGRPSELIRLALDDLKKAERTPGVTIDMSKWCSVGLERCEVCMAGAVMRSRLDAGSGYFTPYSFQAEAAALDAVNCFREGCILSAFDELGLDFPHNFEGRIDVVEYDDDPAKFKRQMAQLATALEKGGY